MFFVIYLFDDPGVILLDVVGVEHVQTSLRHAEHFIFRHDQVFHPPGDGNVFQRLPVRRHGSDAYQLAVQVRYDCFRGGDGHDLPRVARLRVEYCPLGLEGHGVDDLDLFRVVHRHEILPVNHRDGLCHVAHRAMVHVLEGIHYHLAVLVYHRDSPGIRVNQPLVQHESLDIPVAQHSVGVRHPRFVA